MTHLGTVLEPSSDFDAGGSAFCFPFVDENEPNKTYLYYSAASDTCWKHASIGIAETQDGRFFRKLDEINPVLNGNPHCFNSTESVTPVVVRLKNRYYMFFAGSKIAKVRSIGLAYADDPLGPWVMIGRIAKPEKLWEGWSIDLGPGVSKRDDTEVFLYYSNVLNKLPLSLVLGEKRLTRRVGILRVRIESPRSVNVLRYSGNPLKLNGSRGSYSESLFCPGYLAIKNYHILFPSMSTYSSGFPFSQYVGMACGSDHFLSQCKGVDVLIDGPAEKHHILETKREIALDTAAPIVNGGKIWLYYSAMDRYDGVWKTCLSWMSREELLRFCEKSAM
jgi:hypothetical protein